MKHAERAAVQTAFVLVFACSLCAAALASCGTPRRLPAPPDIERRVRSILSLPTVEHEYRDIVYLDEKRTLLLLPISSKKLLFSVRIRVTAGYDLSNGFGVSVRGREGDSLVVRLPQARILDVDAREDTIHEYFASERGDRIRLLEFGDEIERVKRAVAEDAVERGILTRAEENAHRLVRSLLSTLGFSEIAFTSDAVSAREDSP